MKKKIRKVSRFLAIGILALVGLLIPRHASAAEKNGSLTVYYHGVTPQGNQVELSGAEFSLYKVGEKVKNEWELQGSFEAAAVDLKDMSASGQRMAAEQLYDFAVKEQLEGAVRTTGKNGRAFFDDLAKGLYLCVSANEISCDNGIFRSAPFLVFIPEIDESGSCLYDVLVEPKNEWISGDKVPEEQPEGKPEQNTGGTPSEGETVKTGDDTAVEKYIGLLAAGTMIMLFLVFWEIYKKRDKREENF